ncbi:MAG: N-acetylneuraminate synthase family protein [Spirochaetales bacterium]|nr:N-acetylneuraminate synthase family protein [Spirochaetales bacterium]
MKKQNKTAVDLRRVKIIAEIGTSHRGSPSHARELIEAAAEAGADCLKTQIVFADEIIHPNTGDVLLPGGLVSLYYRFRELEQDLDFYLEMKELTENCGMSFLASPFGIKSLGYIKELDCNEIKIASPELNHFPLLKAAAETGKKLLLSTGVSTLSDIEAALAVTGRKNTVIFHCITSYPAPEEEYNLSLLPIYRNLFGTATGISDHSLDPCLVPAVSAALGAGWIEKHFTLSETGGGLDDPIALSFSAFLKMTEIVRRTEAAETPLEMLKAELGRKRIEAVLGNGVKRLAPSETANYGRTNRSIHALSELSAGEVLTEDNTALLRTEKKLRPGLRPEFHNIIIGRKLKRPVGSGEGIIWDDIQ